MSDSASGKPKGERPPRRPGKADPLVATAIGQKLRTMYDGMLAEPVPPDLADLVRRLNGNGADGESRKLTAIPGVRFAATNGRSS